MDTESAAAWWRLAVSLAVCTVGSVGMWSVQVALPVIQTEFGIARADASLPYTAVMAGFAVGGVVMGRFTDRFGIALPTLIGALAIGIGYVLAGLAPSLWLFALAHILVGFGSSATFGPLLADISQWFTRRRGIAVAITASGNYFGGAIWPPLLTHIIAAAGWRFSHIGLGIVCAAALLPLVLALRRPAPMHTAGVVGTRGVTGPRALGISPTALQILLCIAGTACCVAMAMPQVHIVAYCGDLGYGVARGAEMLSAMLGFGVISRIASGLIADRIGGVRTLLLGSILQGVALALYLGFDGLASLYVISALFGLFQGGIVPSYAIIIREYFPAREAGGRVGLVIMMTLVGMAFGGWMSGFIFDLTGSYRIAFLHGIAWNFLNVAIALWLLLRSGPRVAPA